MESERARKIFQEHGFRVDGRTVYFSKKAIEESVKMAPECFTILARNPKNKLEVGGDSFAFGPKGISCGRSPPPWGQFGLVLLEKGLLV